MTWREEKINHSSCIYSSAQPTSIHSYEGRLKLIHCCKLTISSIYVEEEEMPNKVDDHGLVVSAADTKRRLKWTRQLHQHFVEAVTQLGGADKATPKPVMRVMGIPGITLYHLKSHLQKYRLAKNRDHKENNKNEDYRPTEDGVPHIEEHRPQPQFPISRTMLQLQMEVQRKLEEQIEVQKHLQLRIEAQGKYLQSVLRKAQETLASYSLNSIEMEAAKAELSELVSAVDTEYPSSSLSQASSVPKQIPNTDCSTDDSCLTCSERPESKNGKLQHINLETSDCSNNWAAESNEIDPCHYNYSKKFEMEESGDFSGGGKIIGCLHQNEGTTVFPQEIDLNR